MKDSDMVLGLIMLVLLPTLVFWAIQEGVFLDVRPPERSSLLAPSPGVHYDETFRRVTGGRSRWIARVVVNPRRPEIYCSMDFQQHPDVCFVFLANMEVLQPYNVRRFFKDLEPYR